MLVFYETASGDIGRVAIPARRKRVLDQAAAFDAEGAETAPAVYRDETVDEQLQRMLAANGLPGLPWARHVVVEPAHEAASAALDRISFGNWSGAGAIVVAPPAPDYLTAAHVAAAKVLVAQFADEMATLVTGPVPQAERASWPTKEIAARACIDGTPSAQQIAMLEAEALLTGETVAVLAAKIIANADRYVAIAGMIAGQRRRTLTAIDGLTIGMSLKSDLDGVLVQAKTEAQALLAAALQS